MVHNRGNELSRHKHHIIVFDRLGTTERPAVLLSLINTLLGNTYQTFSRQFSIFH